MSKLPSLPVSPTELIKAGTEAPTLLVGKIITSQAATIAQDAAKARAHPDFDVEKYVDRLIASQLKLVRAEGAGAGLAVTLAELSTTVTGPAAVVAAGTTMLADLSALAYFQVQLSLRIAAAYGVDVEDTVARKHEILALHALEMGVTKGGGTKVVATGSKKVAKKLLEKYLKGPALVSLTAMFRFVGIRFSRAALIRGLPVLNVPANAAMADVTTRRIAKKSRDFYRTHPSRP